MSGLVLKGALIEFMPTFLPVADTERDRLPVQPRDDDAYLDPARAGPPTAATEQSNPLAVKGMPGETFSFTIAMDANDEIADGSAPTAALAQTSGIYSRLAALEMLLYPASGGQSGLIGAVSAAIASGLHGQTPARHAPSRSPSCRSPSSSGDPGASCPSG